MVSFRSLALLGLTATLASALESATAIPTPTAGLVAPTTSPSEVPKWEYVGCAAPPSLFSLSGTEVSRGLDNNDKTCAERCGDNAFFFLLGPACHCTNAIVNGTVFVDDGECSTPCPGDSTKFCGRAPATAPLSRRQAVLGGPRISIYRQIIIPIGLIYVDVDVLAYVDINTNNINITNINITETNNIDNSINTNVIDNSINIDNSVSNSNNNNNNNIGNKVIIGNNDIIGNDNVGNNNNVFIDLPLVTKTWCQTTTRTGCGCETTHTVPVCTKTIVCHQCGPEVTTIIVTIPTALPTWLPGIAPVAPTVLPIGPNVLPVAPNVLPAAHTPKITRTIEAVAPTGVKVGAAAAVFTGGAVANGISGGLALVAGALALL